MQNKHIFVFMLFCILTACAQSQSQIPESTVVAWEDMDSLIERSSTQSEFRKNDLGVTVDLPKYSFKAGELIKIKVSLTNKTNSNFVVRKMESMSVFGDNPINIHGVQILVASLDTGSTLQSAGLISSGFLEVGFPRPEDFSIIKPNRPSKILFELNKIFGAIQPGNYSLQVIYANFDFGAQEHIGSEAYFIDFDAWVGEISSNIEQFQITP
jgi:hypothetical protein